jgi:hypothetical protein
MLRRRLEELTKSLATTRQVQGLREEIVTQKGKSSQQTDVQMFITKRNKQE